MAPENWDARGHSGLCGGVADDIEEAPAQARRIGGRRSLQIEDGCPDLADCLVELFERSFDNRAPADSGRVSSGSVLCRLISAREPVAG